VLFIPEAVSRDLVEVDRVLERVEQAFRWEAAGKVHYPEPAALRLHSDDPPGKFHSKGVVLPELGIAGFRVVGYRLREDGSGPSSPESTRLVVLTDLDTGSPLAIVDEHYTYTLRTAASVAAAVRHLCPERPVLGVVGAGGVAHDVVRIFLHALPLEEVLITSRRPQSRTRLAEEAATWGDVPVRAVDRLDDVVDRANLLVTATTTRAPLVDADRVRPGMTLCALGSFELTPAVYAEVDKLVVDDWGQTRRAPDVRPMIDSGVLTDDRLHAHIGEVVVGDKPGRESADETILVRTEGLASQDIALAHWVFDTARARGLGIPL